MSRQLTAMEEIVYLKRDIKYLGIGLVITMIILVMTVLTLWSVQKGVWQAVDSLHQNRLAKPQTSHYVYGQSTQSGLVGDQCIE